MINLIEQAAIKKKEAQNILKDLDLINKWERFGRPVIVGAFVYDLMMSPDIDMEIYCPILKIEHGFQVLSECALNNKVIKAKFSNKLLERDKALYWQLLYKYENGVIWKIDMWSAPHDYDLPRSENFIQPMLNSLTPEIRKIILNLKKIRSQDNSLQCPSIDLYRAVISDNVRTAEDLRKWLKIHKTGDLTDWKPQ